MFAKQNFKLRASPSFVGVLGVTLMITACSQADAPALQESAAPVVQAMASPAAPAKPVKTYAVLEFSKALAVPVGVTDGMPKAEAEAKISTYFKAEEGAQDNSTQNIEFERDTLASGISRTVVTRTGLLDDSVSAEQFIAMFKTAPNGSETLFNHGLRIKCARPVSENSEDTRDWQNSLCP